MAINSYPADKKGISNSQWTYTAAGGETTLSGYDSKGQPLQYLVNQEQFFLNGVMLVRNVDYTASTGTSITGLTALSAGDFVEILTYSNFLVSTIPATQITGNVQNSQLQNNSITLGSTTLSLGGTSSSISGLTIDGTNNTIRTNRGATNPVTATAGDMFWNTTVNALQVYNGSTWTSFAPPSSPAIGSASDVATARPYNNAAALVSFTPNVSGGAATSYFATSSPGGINGYGLTSPITITGLNSSTQYTFTVTAQGSFGNSAPSSSTGALTVTSVPQAPTIGTATATGSSTATVTFTAGATGGSAITGYTVTASTGGVVANGTSSPITVTGLNAGTSYTFTVTATNANGTSVPSAGSNSITTVTPVITGGTLSSDTTYYYRTFTGNGSLVVANAAVSMDILTIAGGGGGGAGEGPNGAGGGGGGGGAGGLLYSPANNVATGTYAVTIGGGGSGSGQYLSQATAAGNNGANSSVIGGSISLTAIGGGGGSSEQNNNPGSGGSGGGAGGDSGASTGGSGTTGQGYAGGTYGNLRSGGGGGGAGGTGAAGTATGTGSGGVGSSAYASWLTAIKSGLATDWQSTTSTGYIASGGNGGTGGSSTSYPPVSPGGGGQCSTNGGSGGSGGGAGFPGISNTGGGGGGESAGGGSNAGGTGGSGLVVVRYTKASVGG
jgi:hypothetical protein